MKFPLLFLFGSFFFFANFCLAQNLKPKPSGLSISCTDCSEEQLKLSTANMLTRGYDQLASIKMDSNGSVEMKISLSEMTFAYLKVGKDTTDNNRVFEICLLPGEDLKINLTGNSASFEGKGKEINYYLQRSKQVFLSYIFKDEKWMSALSFEDQKIRLKNLENEFRKIESELRQNGAIAKELADLIVSNNTFLLSNEKRMYFRNLPGFKPDSNFRTGNFFREIPVNNEYLNANLKSYARLIKSEFQNKLYVPYYYDIQHKIKADEQDTLALIAEQEIKNDKRLNPIKEYLLAMNVYYWLHSVGVTPAVLLVYDHFTLDYPDSKYDRFIQMEFNSFAGLSEGTEAKNFTGVTETGKEISLKDLKGKIIYVDTWATWCVPCLQEFPYSKKLQQRYADNNKIAFLYVSIDTETDKWKKFLIKNRDLKGIHLNQSDQNAGDSIWNLYAMRGIPHYILIDQNGKIKRNFAPRPSSEKIAEEIDKMLLGVE